MSFRIVLRALFCFVVGIFGHGHSIEIDTFNEISDFLSYVKPLFYDIHLQLPLDINVVDDINIRKIKPRQVARPREYVTKGNISFTFNWNTAASNQTRKLKKPGPSSPQRLLALHAKNTEFSRITVRFYRIVDDVDHKMHVDRIWSEPGDELFLIRLRYNESFVSDPASTYRLHIDNFYTRVQIDGSRNGAFLTSPGISTQFQLNEARAVFPCVDAPEKKAFFKFRITHPSPYFALSNTDAEFVTETADWTTTQFFVTPRMSTYITAFSLLPKSLLTSGHETTTLVYPNSNDVRISVYYNPDRLTDTRVSNALMRHATYAFDSLKRTFGAATTKYPMRKLDVSVVKGLSILGMENWGLVNLREEYMQKESDSERFGLLAHEIAHQWIGDLATTADWHHLCVQEGLTEYYARRTLADFYGGEKSKEYQRYIFVRYLPAVVNETNNVGLKPLRQDFRGFDEAVAYCFGRSPFIWGMMEKLMGGRAQFDTAINRFLSDFAYESFVLEDLAPYFGQASNILRYYIDHGGYPSLFVRRLNTTVYRLKQRQVVPLALGSHNRLDSSFEIPSTKSIWPIPVSTVEGYVIMDSLELDIPATSVEFDKSGVPMLNPNFAFFYRVNYELETWRRIADTLVEQLRQDNFFQHNVYSETVIAQFLNDFCFFRGLNLISVDPGMQNENQILDEVTRKFNGIANRLEEVTRIYVRLYTKGC